MYFGVNLIKVDSDFRLFSEYTGGFYRIPSVK